MRLSILAFSVWLFLGVGRAVGAEPGEENICPVEERYTVNVTQLVWVPYQVRSYKWCLDYPPRCSVYTTEERPVEEVVPEEKTRIVYECCPDFHQDPTTEKCVSDADDGCGNCVNGDCVSNKCDCHPGYWNNNCSLVCEGDKWGKNCTSDCVCENGLCDPISGSCSCAPGWRGDRCEKEIIEPTTVQHSTTTQRAETTTVGTSSESFVNVTSVTEWLLFNSSIEHETITTLSPEVESKPVSIASHYNESESEEEFSDQVSSTTDHSVSNSQYTITQPQGTTIKTITTITSEPSSTATNEEEWFNSSNLQHPNVRLPVKEDQQNAANSHMLFSIVAVAGIIATVIFIVILTTSKFKVKKPETVVVVAEKAQLNREENGLSAVKFYSHVNIFSSNGQNGTTFHDKLENPSAVCADEPLETRVICNLAVPTPISNFQNSFYDHPPSSGSYRAASIPEPPEDISNQLLSVESKENLYDEIPCWNQPLKISENNSFRPNETFQLYENGPK